MKTKTQKMKKMTVAQFLNALNDFTEDGVKVEYNEKDGYIRFNNNYKNTLTNFDRFTDDLFYADNHPRG